jgi:hypothetical protein
MENLVSVDFPKDKFSRNLILLWFKKHHIMPIKEPQLEENFVKVRVKEAMPNGYYHTIKLKDGINLVFQTKI